MLSRLPVLCGVLVVACLSGAVGAEDSPLRWEIVEGLSARTGGPLTLHAKLHWAGSKLLEGRLAAQIRDGGTVHCRVLSSVKVLQTGTSDVALLVPAIESGVHNSLLQIHGEFLTDSGQRFELGFVEQALRGSDDRRFRILRCDPDIYGASDVTRKLLSTLRVERFIELPPPPDAKTASIPTGLVETQVASLTPIDLPEDPHWLCTTDLLLLGDSGFGSLRLRQLDAIRQWVRAGGHLIVEPLGVLDARHVDFLNQLGAVSDENGESVRFQVNVSGELERSAGQPLQKLHAGLGRLVLLQQSISRELDVESNEWTDTVAFVWGFRRDQRQHLSALQSREDGRETLWHEFKFRRQDPRELFPATTQWRDDSATLIQPYYRGGWESSVDIRDDDFGVHPVGSGQGLLKRLMPDDVSVIPLGLIVLILMFYVAAIGPGDYLLLGAFKLRRFTWITFPATTVAFTLFTIWLSHQFLDTDAEQGTVTVFDLDAASPVASLADVSEAALVPPVVRLNRFELLFTGATSDVTTELHSALFTPFDHTRFGGYLGNRYQPAASRHVGGPLIEGSPPGAFAAVQQIPQWTPQINRVFSIEPAGDAIPASVARFDWLRQRDFGSDSERVQLGDDIRQVFGSESRGFLFNGRDVWRLADQSDLFEPNSMALIEPTEDQNSQANHLGNVSRSFLEDISVRLNGPGLFGVVSQVAPHGGDNLEDLAVLDPSDASQWLLVIAEVEGEHVRIYRRLYRTPQ